MKNGIKKYIYYTSLILCFIGLTFSLFLQATYYHFNSKNVKNNIKLITSNDYDGRLTGSLGNYKISEFIEKSFEDSKLAPLNNTYRESFKVKAPIKNNSSPHLLVKKGSEVVYEYKYGIDFKEDMTNFRTSSATFSRADTVDIYRNSFVVTHSNLKYLFYVSFDKNFDFRSSFNADSSYEFSVAITTDLYNELLDSLRSGNTITVNLPYTIESVETSNIIGVLKGSSNDLPPLIVSAHFDHLGTDSLGNYYNGALDNASGTAFMLELSKNLSSFIKPKRDIIFVALTGEEFGLLGSKKFVSDYSNEISGGKAINFDMIGAPNVPLTLLSGTNSKDKLNKSEYNLINSLKNISSDLGTKYVVKFEDSSDHASFSNIGIDSVTICHSDLSRIHTPNDTVRFIDTDAIDNVYSIVQKEIYSYAYNNFILLLYSPTLSLFFSIIFIILIIFPAIKYRLKTYMVKIVSSINPFK